MILWVFIFKIIPKERIKTAKAISILLQESKCFVLKWNFMVNKSDFIKKWDEEAKEIFRIIEKSVFFR